MSEGDTSVTAMKNVFETIYRNDHWRGGSGEGSVFERNTDYVAYLQDFLAAREIRSVVDLGCGDWQFSRHVDWTGIRYDGVDLVDSVIERNRAAFGQPDVQFHIASGDWSDLPEADLLIAKDVLQHWPVATILEFLPVLSRYRYALITNCIGDYGPPKNSDIKMGAFRPLDLRAPPFNVAAEEVLRYRHVRRRIPIIGKDHGFQKAVLLIEAKGARD